MSDRAFSQWLKEASKSDKLRLRQAIIAALPHGWMELTDKQIKSTLADTLLKVVSDEGFSVGPSDLEDILDLIDDWEFQKPFDISAYDVLS